jgi:ribonuclease P protein component
MTLARSEMLKRRSDLVRVLRGGTRVAGPALWLRFAPQPVSPAPQPATERRIAFLLSRPVGCAVVRNRVKRRLREAYRRHKSWFPPGYDYVLGAMPAAAALTLEQLETETGKLAGRVPANGHAA